ncbi:uncharacterized protein METZ01_LOCUS21527 [marine metagenome]|uniref:Uncharacterized protein n=1 Tax=marine metagenome TaxID=408172 RepID=A0A381PT82_9ZZZZ
MTFFGVSCSANRERGLIWQGCKLPQFWTEMTLF